MGYAAIIVVGVVAVLVCLLLLQMLRWRERSWERKEQIWSKERGDLLNRIMFLSDRPWAAPDYPDLPEQPLAPIPLYAEQEPLE